MQVWARVWRCRSILAACGLVLGFLLGGAARDAFAQDKSSPTALYYLSFAPLYDGDFADAEKAFNDELRGGIKTLQTRWIDSICYHTMCGEAAYYQGKFNVAMDHYNSAVKLY